jgi:hypothetical protein
MSQRTLRRTGLVVAAAGLATAAALPHAVADPTPAPQYATDEHGYIDSAARCDDDQMLMEFGRTARAMVAICVSADGRLEYRAARISDQAALTMPAGKGADGAVVATNDDVTYVVTKDLLLVSEGDTVLHRDPWVEFHNPRFPGGGPAAPTATPTTTSAPAPSTAPSTTAAPPTTTVSTTTVTPTRKAG